MVVNLRQVEEALLVFELVLPLSKICFEQGGFVVEPALDSEVTFTLDVVVQKELFLLVVPAFEKRASFLQCLLGIVGIINALNLRVEKIIDSFTQPRVHLLYEGSDDDFGHFGNNDFGHNGLKYCGSDPHGLKIGEKAIQLELSNLSRVPLLGLLLVD